MLLNAATSLDAATGSEMSWTSRLHPDRGIAVRESAVICSYRVRALNRTVHRPLISVRCMSDFADAVEPDRRVGFVMARGSTVVAAAARAGISENSIPATSLVG